MSSNEEVEGTDGIEEMPPQEKQLDPQQVYEQADAEFRECCAEIKSRKV